MIRKFTEHEEQFFVSMCMDFYNTDGVDHKIPVRNITKTFDKLMHDSSFCEAYAYVEDNEPKAYVLLAFTYSNESGGDVVWIEELYVSPDLRGKGIGSRLLDFVMEKYSYVSRFRLEVTENNAGAVKLYSKKGFKPLKYNQMEIMKTEL